MGGDVLNALKAIYPTLAKKIKVYIVPSSISPVDILRSKGYEFVRQLYQNHLPKRMCLNFLFKTAAVIR